MNEIKQPAIENIENMECADLIELVGTLQSRVAELESQVAEQAEKIKSLEAQLAKDSHNSGKPPSSDGLKKPKKTKSLRSKTGRSVGGQKGHKGHRLEMAEVPDKTENHHLTDCPDCKNDLSQEAVKRCERRQVYDLPPEIQLEVTEHQAEIKDCPHCEKEVMADFPEHVTQPTQYGPRFKAQACYLNTYQMLPVDRTAELLEDFYGKRPSNGFILGANAQVEAKTESSVDAIKEQLKKADVTHHDESGVRVAGKTQWLHVSSTEDLTHYQVHQKRGKEAMDAIDILPKSTGIIVHDHWKSYLSYDNVEHAFCNAHHLRELIFMVEQHQQDWAQEMISLLCEIKKSVDEFSSSHPDAQSLPPDICKAFETQYDTILQHGFDANPQPPPDESQPKKRGRQKQTPPKNFLDRLQIHKAGVLAFMSNFRVPFDNNLAERDVRMIKVKQKISGSFRSDAGASTFCNLRSYISTVRKRGLNVLSSLSDALLGNPFIPRSSDTASPPPE